MEDMLKVLGKPSSGFESLASGPDEIVLRVKRRNIGGMLFLAAFLSIWLSGWTFGCAMLLMQFIKSPSLGNGVICAVFWGAELLVACILAATLFAKSTLKLDKAGVVAENRILFAKWSSSASRDSISDVSLRTNKGSSSTVVASVKGGGKPLLLPDLSESDGEWLRGALRAWAGIPDGQSKEELSVEPGKRSDSFESLRVEESFARLQSDDDVLILLHKRNPGALGCFLLVWLAGWSAGCGFMGRELLHGTKDTILYLIAPVFFAAEIGVAAFALNTFFARKTFYLDKSELWMESSILGFKRRKSIGRDAIESLRQVKDGGEGEDSFPSWGLELYEKETGRKMPLLFRQPYEQSLWLGSVIARWSGAGFEAAPPP